MVSFVPSCALKFSHKHLRWPNSFLEVATQTCKFSHWKKHIIDTSLPSLPAMFLP